MTVYYEFREQWLVAASQDLDKYFEEKGFSTSTHVKISCGWPVGNRGSKRVKGQCFDAKASKGGFTEIFLSPMMESPEEVIGVLFHEKLHQYAGNAAGHGPGFRKYAEALGFTGKMTSCLPGPALMQRLREEVLPALGDYPHASVDFNQRKKQGTRMIKLVCPETGYTVRTTAKWIAQGLPTSPAGHVMQIENDEGGEE